MRSTQTLILLLFTVSLAAQEFSGKGADIVAIQEQSKAFSMAYVHEDYDSLMAIYSADAKIFPPNSDIITGQDEVRKRWTLPKGTTILTHHIDSKEITAKDDIAYDYGYYKGSSSDKDGTISYWKGTYVIVWEKVNGTWKIYLDSWNRIPEDQ
ncbi:MAG: DUF4440 domain-containing protein [Flavobacteriaceae bacterium]|nr:DUF4440 domain-containing protein [Flavobacteriaceae bacterium]